MDVHEPIEPAIAAVEELLGRFPHLLAGRLGHLDGDVEGELWSRVRELRDRLTSGSWRGGSSVVEYQDLLKTGNHILDQVAIAELLRLRGRYETDRNPWQAWRRRDGLEVSFRTALRRADFAVRMRRNVLAEHPRVGEMVVPVDSGAAFRIWSVHFYDADVTLGRRGTEHRSTEDQAIVNLARLLGRTEPTVDEMSAFDPGLFDRWLAVAEERAVTAETLAEYERLYHGIREIHGYAPLRSCTVGECVTLVGLLVRLHLAARGAL